MSLSNTGIDRFLQQNYYSKTQLNAGQLDSRYYAESEFLATSAGAGDAGKPVKLNGSGALDATLYASSVVTLTGTQTLTNKTLTAPVISTIVNTGTLTLPTSTDTLVGRATTDTLTNKTLTSPNFGLTNWTIGTLTTNPVINFDANDYLTYDRSSNAFNTLIGSSTITSVSATGLAVNGTIVIGGVTVPTISSISTLTNKTITDPLISRVYGGSAANDDLTIEGTSSATKTSSTVYLQPTGGTVGVGFASDPGQPFAVRLNNSAVYISPYNGAVDQGLIYAYNPATPADIPMVIQGSYVRLISLSGSRYQMYGTFTPTGSADATGTEGDVSFDASYMYRKTAAGWKRAALSTF